MKIYSLIILILTISACSSQPIIQTGNDIEVGRKIPMGSCEEIGLLRGTTMTSMETKEDALSDLKETAASKGATYIKVEQFSETGTSVTGIAYTCK